jgi:hypothetical protein
MNLPVLGFGLVAIGRIILSQIHSRYLNQASRGVSIDGAKDIVLRYAIWYYVYPLLAFACGILMAWGIHQGSPHPEAIFIYKISFLFFFFGGIFLLYRQLTARVKISAGKLIYTEGGDRWEFLADDVTGVSLKGFAFLVNLKWQKTVKIPSTFAHSEVILAFLRHAAASK